MSELHHEKQKSPLLSCSGWPGFFIDNLITFTIGYVVSTSDNNQIKPGGKDYVNVKMWN